MNATGSRVIIKKVDADKETASGIILKNPNAVPKTYVVRVGPRVEVDIKEGDEIIVDWTRIGRFEYLEQEYFIVDEKDVWAVVE